MAEYGLHVNGSPPTDGLSMLVDLVTLPTSQSAKEGEYFFPEMTDEQKGRFFHYFSPVDTAVMYGKTALQLNGAGKIQIVRVSPILKNGAAIDGLDMNEVFRSNKVAGFRWKAMEVDYFLASDSCQAVMVWRGVR
nr:MAG TPA: hypothetical protein [Caudoviricetes sp.]